MMTTIDLHGETDATIWAKEFMRIWSDRREEIDEDLMVGWFANAIESGRSKGEESSP